jgi:lysophospholipase L1-like esterase
VVFLGDSITQGWTTLKKDFPELKVANRGIGGDTTRGVLYRLDADVLSLEPAAVVLLIGTNDLGLGGDPEQVAANIREIIAELRKANKGMPIILCKVMPSSESKGHPATTIKKLNASLDEIGKADSLVKICDTWSIYAGADGDCKPEEFPDRLHPNTAGYAKWRAALRPILVNNDHGR